MVLLKYLIFGALGIIAISVIAFMAIMIIFILFQNKIEPKLMEKRQEYSNNYADNLIKQERRGKK
jgi:hypothetical protein